MPTGKKKKDDSARWEQMKSSADEAYERDGDWMETGFSLEDVDELKERGYTARSATEKMKEQGFDPGSEKDSRLFLRYLRQMDDLTPGGPGAAVRLPGRLVPATRENLEEEMQRRLGLRWPTFNLKEGLDKLPQRAWRNH